MASRGPIEAALCAKEKSLFSLKESILLYDLTSTYFEGLCLSNPKAKRGYSRDSRPDCKQVVVGLVLDGEGFPKAHKIFAGNRSDSTTVADMLAVLQKRVGKTKDATVVVDRAEGDVDQAKKILESLLPVLESLDSALLCKAQLVIGQANLFAGCPGTAARRFEKAEEVANVASNLPAELSLKILLSRVEAAAFLHQTNAVSGLSTRLRKPTTFLPAAC